MQNGISLVLSLGLFVVKGFALVDAIIRPEQSYAAHDTLAKNGWLLILGLGFVAHVLMPEPLGLLNVLGTVAALVYLAQLRGSSPRY